MKTERKEKFTPGPWEYDKYSLYVDSVPRVVEEYSEEICEVSGCRKQDEANGYLIAAAPEMYEMLKQLHGALASVPVLQSEIDKILKKARGEA